MDPIIEALNRYLSGLPELPQDLDDVAGAFGRSPREQNPAIAQELAGTTDKSSPAYKAALRRVERWRQGTRGVDRATLAGLAAAARRRLAAANVARVRRGGLHMRLGAVIRVSRVFKFHVMPADAGGVPRYQRVPPGGPLGRCLDAWTIGDEGEAADELLHAFFAAYWGNEEPCEVGEVVFCELR